MHNRWLYVGLYFCVLVALPIYFQIFVVVIAVLYYRKYYKDKMGFVILILLFLFLLVPSASLEKPTSKVLQVQEVRDSYVIATNQNQKHILYNVTNVSVADIIEVEGEYEEVYSQKNANTFQFETFLKRRKIYTSMYVKSCRVIKQSNTLKARMYRRIQNIENKKTKKNINALFYHIDEEDQNLIFASGMHISFLSFLIAKHFHKKKENCDIVFSFFYFLLFPTTVFVIRIFFFALVSALLKGYDKRDQLGITILVLLLYNTSFLYEISFQLPVLFRLIYLFDLRRVSNKIKNAIILFPYQLYVFHECYPLKILCFSLYRQLGGFCFLMAIVTLFVPPLQFVFNFLFDIYHHMDTFFLHTYSIIGKPYILWIVCWSITTLSFICVVSKKSYLTFIILLFIQCNLSLFHPFGEVTFLDVGQGDSILIREPFNGEVVLIDVAGKIGRNLPEERIYPYLKMKGIKKIDKVIITHDDYDHSGGLKELKNLIKVKEVIREKRRKICMQNFCLENVSKKQYEDKNDNSIVLFSHIAKLNYVFMGDASRMVENDIVQTYNKLECDILKVGHHGSNTSSSREFIAQMNPNISVISSGYKNMYGHPHKEVIELLQKSNSKILNTQDHGSISVHFSPFINILKTGNNEFAILNILGR